LLNEIIAKRYAKALLAACESEKEFAKINKQFTDFIETIVNNEKLEKVLISPAISPIKKKNILTKISKKSKLHPILENFFILINDKGRLSIIDDIYTCYQRLLNEKEGIVVARMHLANKISDKETKEISKQLERITGKKIALELIEDKDLIGGVKIQIGGTIYDGSLRNKFQMLRKQLTGE
jgi:F-type H+-transporting ATPase subunit delta